MNKSVFGYAWYIFSVEYSDGAELGFECTEEEIAELAERFSIGHSYVIYKVKEIKEVYKEIKK